MIAFPAIAHAAAPTTTTNAATGITTSSAVLNGAGDPNGEATTGWFRYSPNNPVNCNDSFGTRVPAASGTDLGTGTIAVPYSITTTGLTPGVTYYFCSIVQNPSGIAFGAVLSFTIPSAPVTLTTGAVSVTSSSATLQGSANPVASTTTGWFRYATVNPGSCNDTFGTRAPTGTGGSNLGSGTASVDYTRGITGLLPGTTYYYCAVASNMYGTTFGDILFFTTPATAPSVTTNSATGISTSAATLNATGIPRGDTTIGWFRYSTVNPGSCNDTFGIRLPAAGGTALGSDNSSVPFSEALSGLSLATTYYYCAIAQNGIGITFGGVVSFTTSSTAPTVTTNAATAVAGTSATLQGTGTPNGSSTSAWFRYSTANPGACNDLFGTRAPSSSLSDSQLGSGTAPLAFSRAIGGLTPTTTYYYCAIAQNGIGTSFGAVLSFTTPAMVPSVTTLTTTITSGTAATFNAQANPNGADTTGWFRYATVNPGSCNDTFGTRTPGAGGSALGAGVATVMYSEPVTGLTPLTTYYVCAIAQNSVGTGFGTVQQFTTPAAPTVTTTAASSVTNAGAQLNGSANPNRATATGWFRYASVDPGTCNDSFGSRAPVSGGSNLGAGSSATTFGQSIGSLSPGTTYYYCAIASNSEGIAFGAVLSFTTLAAPSVVTNAATAVMSSSATLHGAANPNGATTTGWFRYAAADPGACNDTFGTRAPFSGGSSLGFGTMSQSYQQAIAGLVPGTTYYYCAIANNSYGTSFGTLMTFTTPAAAPEVTTSTPSMLTGTTAQLNGSADPGGSATTGWFRYAIVSPGSCNDSFGTRAPAGTGGSALGAGTDPVAFSQAIAGLTPATTYFVCAIAENAVGVRFGALVQFTTPAPPTVTTGAATSITNTSAVLNGTANPNRAATTAWFRYSSNNPGSCNDTFGSRAPVSGGDNMGSGSSAASFSETITGLSSGTTYYVCAIAQNSEGTSFGTVVPFTTAGAPTVTTNAATVITASSAQLNGTANPNFNTTTGWFRYSTGNPGSCNDSFGTRAPASGGSSLGNGSMPASYAQSIGGLTPNTTYYFCAIAQNTYGTSFGSVLSFTTPALPPSVTTSTVNPFTGTTATLNGNANPNGADATGWFRYGTVSPGSCNDSFGTRAPGSGGAALGAGIAGVPFSQAISGLTPATTYFVCAISSNALGTSFGNVVQFTTAAPPTVTTSAASSISNTSAQLNGSANPNRAATTGWFRYATVDPGTCSDAFGTRAPVSGGTNLGSSSSAVSFQQSITGLSAGTTYFYCAIAQNGEGTAFGAVLSFTTQAAPAVVTNAATSVTATGAILNGSANPNGASATGWFRYATANPGVCTDSFGTRAPASGGSSLGSGSMPASYAQSIGGLTPATTYYYCALASNIHGTSVGTVLSFTTPALAPSVTTSSITPFTGTTATLNGSANPNGADATGWFRYATVSPGSCNDTFGTRAPAGTGGSPLGAGNGNVAFSQSIGGLTPGTTYFVCAIAQNSVGTSFGSVVQFTTAAPPVMVTTAASSILSTGATLNGNGNPNRAATTGWYRYATVDPGSCNDTFGTRAPAAGGTNLGSGSSPVSYSVAITGLAPATTYYACAIGQNGEGLGVGGVITFTTLATPTVVTSAATLVTTTTATLNGSANPHGSSTSGYFRYSTVNPGVCNDSFGTRAPLSGGSSLGAGTMPVNYSQAIGSLLPGSTYYYCAIATNGVGTSFGDIMQFTANAGAPSVTTSVPTGVTTTTATLNGSANPNGASTTAWFRIATVDPGSCNDSFGTRVPGIAGAALGTGNSPVTYSEALTNLVPGTTYYYCAIAQNSVGTGFGIVRAFATPQPPSVATLAATPVTATTATLNAQGNPNGFATTGWFRYATIDPVACSDSFGTRAPVSGGAGLGSGTAPVAFNQALTGLAPGTTYYFCAIAQSSIGMTLGEVLSFTTPPTQPSVTTLPATAVDMSSATLEGSGNPNADPTTAWFRYATVNPGTCNDSFGTRAPASGGTALGSGNNAVTFSQPLTGLGNGTTYYYCAIASNGVGVSFGVVLQFTTASAPSVTTSAATAVTSSAATLNGSANPNFAATTGWFRYATNNPGACDDSFGTRAPSAGGTALGAGSAPVAYNQPITGLAAGTQYYYCAIASNVVGIRFGTVQTFTTSSSPSVTTDAVTAVTGTTATLNGTANPNGISATGYFRYATVNPGSCNDTFGTRAPLSGGTALGAGTAAVPYNRAITGLVAGTTYYYCAIAANSVGTGFGAIASFTTAAAPSVTTEAVSALAPTSVTLNGSANPNQLTTTGWFRYSTANPGSCNDTFGTRAPLSGGAALGAGTAAAPYSQAVTGLVSGSTYYYCAIASNSLGTRFGSVLTFTTPAAPLVTTSAATALTSTTATLNGSANPRGSAATGWFRYATANPGTCNDTFGIRAPATGGTDLGAGSVAVTYNEPLTGLAAGTTYYFCALAQNGNGTAVGLVLTFTTPDAPAVTTTAATGVGASTATLNGTGDPNGAAATGWFRYATVDPGTCDDTFGTRAPASGGTSLGSGTAPIAFNQPLTGLLSGTQYYYCAIASNSVGTSFGTVLTFTTAQAPTMTTEPATLVTGTGATLNGTGDPNGTTATGWFRYATINPMTCNDTFGTRAPLSGGTALGAGTAPIPYSRAITGLTSGTTYYFCAIASNSVGTGLGTVRSFTTPGAPSVTTLAATGVTSTGATLEGSANPNAGLTTGWFRYASANPGTCSDTFGTRAPGSGGTDLGAGTAPVTYSQAITGLTPGVTYYYCAIASNASGTRFGTVLTFTAQVNAPTVVTTAATAVTSTAATLGGTATPNGGATAGWFRYSAIDPGTCDDTFGTRAPAAGGTALGAGGNPVPYTQPVTGLTPGTVYYVCAIASNSVGTRFGAVLTFTTTAAPTVTSEAASSVTSTAAVLNGTADPNLAQTTAWFRYGATDPGACDDTFGTRAPASGGTDAGSGNAAVPYGQAITGLVPAQTYYYCAIAANAAGTSFGAVRTLTTTTAPPTVTTNAATDVLIDSAALNGSVIANGDATTGWFRYATVDPGSCNDTFGVRVPASGGQPLGAGTAAVAYAEAVTGLAPATTYYYCAIAANALGTSFGAVLTFEPGADPPVVTTEPATGVTGTDAMLAGTANPNGTAAIGWFRLGETEPALCDDGFGMRAPASGDIALGAGTVAAPFSTPATGLLPNATYWYCAAASNLGGASFGAERSFTTPAIPPEVVTMSAFADAEGVYTATGTANPHGAEAIGWFRYSSESPGTCNDTFGTRTAATADVDLDAGRAFVRFTVILDPLPPGVYYLCAIASNSAGVGVGEPLMFEVYGPPEPGGCCQIGGRERSPWPSVAPLALVFLALLRRRRRRS